MPDFTRDLSVTADGVPLAAGCPVSLSARAEASLRPRLSSVRIRSLSASSRELLLRARRIRVSLGGAILAEGDLTETVTLPDEAPDASPVTVAVFSEPRALPSLPVSLTVPPGTPCSAALRLLLESSGSGVPLAGFTGADVALSRPRTFYGSLPEALSAVAELAEARAFLTPAGLVCAGKAAPGAALEIPESDLLAPPVPAGGRILLSTVPKGWPLGVPVRARWRGSEIAGAALERATEADNRSGPWFTQLILEVIRPE